MKTKAWLVLAITALTLLAAREAMAGACISARFHDWQDMGCNQNYAGAGGPPKAQCPDCQGMPRWWVSEPYINLCMSDTPLSYRLSSGKEMDFTFYYRQHTTLPGPDEVTALPVRLGSEIYPGMYPIMTGSTCGTNASWANNWNMSITIWDPVWENNWSLGTYYNPPTYAVYSQGYQAFVWRPEGGINYFNVQANHQNTIDPQSQMRLTSVNGGTNYPVVESYYGGITPVIINAPTSDSNGIYWGDSGIGLKLVYPDGSQDVFGLSAYPMTDCKIYNYMSPAGTSTERLFLTQRIDPQGRATQLGYEQVTNAGTPFYRVRYVVDPDYRTTTFHYNSGFQISEIDDPFGRKTQLTYTTIYGGVQVPASIIDAAGLTNSFSYYGAQPTNGWITSLTTPYGTTLFNYYAVTDSSVTNGYEQRALYVNEPEGAQQLYLYQHQNPGIVPSSETSPNVTGQADFDNGSSPGLSTHGALTYRNTFHWGRRQYAAMASNYYLNEGMSESLRYESSNPSYSQSEFASALSALSANDYTLADEKHWLLSSDLISITEGLSSERDPSPDLAGQIPGLRTWYNYIGKPSPELLGTNPQIDCIARLLPNGDTQYTSYNYYPTTLAPGFPAGAGFVSSNSSSYSIPNGANGALLTSFNYATNSVDLVSVSNSAGQYVNLGYNSNHQITAMTNALGQQTTLTWDSFTLNLAGVVYPSGQSISASYNYPQNPASGTSSMLQWLTIQPAGRCFTNNSYYAGFPTSVTDDRGVTVRNTWDGLNRLTGTTFPDGSSISNVYSRLDVVGRQDRLGNWTYFTYDALQHLTTNVNANGAVTSYSYCGCGSLDSILDALGNNTYLNYDNQGSLTNVTFPDSSSLNWQYDLARRVAVAFDGGNRYFQFAYNNQGLVTNVTSANGAMESTVYDVLNRPISVTDANGVTVTNQYDGINELLQRTWADTASERYGYSAAGLIAYTNRDGFHTFYTRDAASRLMAVTNANREVIRFSYDSMNNVTSLIDGTSNQTRWQYNQYGWLTNKMDGLGRTDFNYAYNANGWVTNRWTPEKGNTAYSYDGVGNLKAIVYPIQTINYAYDALNQLTNMIDASGTNMFSYTPLGQLQNETGPWPSDAVGYSYSQGLRMNMSLTQPVGSWSENYTYDSGWRLQTLTSMAGSFSYNYNFQPASSLVTAIALPNGASVANGYDALARLRQTALVNYWGHTLDGYSYIPDPLGLRTNIVRSLGLTTNSVMVAYDNVGQLTSWSAIESNGALRLNEQLGFGYDPGHNLHSRTNGGLSILLPTDAANQLTNVTRMNGYTLTGATPSPATNVTVNGQAAQIYSDFTFARTNIALTNGLNVFTSTADFTSGAVTTNTLAVTLPQTVTLLYDNNGNLTNDGLKTFGYDSENQLTNVFVPTQWRSDFVYDGWNRRRIEHDYAWISNAWSKTNETHFIYDGYLLIQERNVSNNVVVTYTRGLDFGGSLQQAGGIGGLLARTDNNGSTFYHSDGAGNITALTDGSQNVLARYLYNPFGKLVGQWGSMAGVNEMQFSSMPHHSLSGLSLYAFRAYEPNLQRWLNQDPIQENGGFNLYGFVGNNPINYVDSLGLLDYYYSGGGFFQPSGPAPYLEGDSWYGQLGSALYNTIPLAANALNKLAPGDIGTDEGNASGNGNYLGMLAAAGIDAAGLVPGEGSGAKLGKPSLTACKKALKKVQNEVGKLPKGKPGKFGSPQAGTPKLGYRFDPAHPDMPASSPESQPHFNWWDWTGGKKGSGGRYGAIPIE